VEHVSETQCESPSFSCVNTNVTRVTVDPFGACEEHDLCPECLDAVRAEILAKELYG
jgi:hypothetical protein